MKGSFSEVTNFIWSVADLIRDVYKRGKYADVILPFTVLRRIDCVLAPGNIFTTQPSHLNLHDFSTNILLAYFLFYIFAPHHRFIQTLKVIIPSKFKM